MALYENPYARKTKGRRTRRGRHRRWQLMLLLVALLLVLAFFITKIIQLITGAGGPGDGGTGTSQSGQTSSTTPPDSSTQSGSTQTGDISYRYNFPQNAGGNSFWKLPEDVPATTDQTLRYAYSKMLALPANGRVLESYFDNVTFVGDSLTQGIQQYELFPNANYCAFKGISPQGFMGLQPLPDGTTAIPLDLIQAVSSRRVYVLLGTNAMAYMTDEALLTYYSQLMDELAARLPNSEIYIQSITPTTAKKGEEANFALQRIINLNNAIAGLAFNHGFHFVDIYSVLAGEDGYAIPELIYESDGYHFRPEGYAVWKEYLITHVAHADDVQYEYGSPYYYGGANG